MLPTRPRCRAPPPASVCSRRCAPIARPKLHLWADSDPIIPFKVGERFAAAINAEPPEKIENASHFLQEDAGEQIGARIADWLGRIEPMSAEPSDEQARSYRLGTLSASAAQLGRHRRSGSSCVIVRRPGRRRGHRQADLDDLTLPGTGSTEATDLLADKLPKEQNGTVPIVLVAKSGTLDEGANAKAVKKTVKSLARRRGRRARPSARSRRRAPTRSRRTRRSAYISLTLSDRPGDLTEDEADEIIDAAQPARRRRARGLGRRLSRPAGLEAGDRVERGDRARRRR